MKRWKAVAALVVSAAMMTALTPASAMASSAPALTGKLHGVTLTFMFGSSGAAETTADKTAVAAWAAQTGNKVQVIVASNLTQQLTESFAGGTPPDVFYGSTAMFESLVKNGDLLASGNLVAPARDFYPALVQAFTYNHTWYCVPKDSSTLALEINTADWTAAGLTRADLPTTWARLASDAKAMTKGKVTGLVLSNTLDRLGAFFAENGGSYMNSAGTKFAFDSPQNVAALQWVQNLAKSGALKFAPQVNAGWGGQAIGDGSAAMTVEGNWIIGAMQSTYPKISYEVVPMPAGPSGHHGTLVFTNCWGIAAQSKNTAAAVSLVKYLSSTAQQIRFANAFGVMPSRPAAAKAWAAGHTTAVASGNQIPDVAPFVQGDAYALPQVETLGFPTVQSAFDSQVEGLATGSSNAAQMLSQLQQNADALLQP
jgi:multiple sugar transport system substrate-binding protein